MALLKLLLVFISLVNCNSYMITDIPKDFMIGVSSSAYEVEGAWNVLDKTPSIWDTFTHDSPNKIKNGSNADISADQYKKYEDDIELLQYLGVDHYHLSISWSRILPRGNGALISISGVDHYNNVIDKLLAAGITPFVTMYNSDHPQELEDMGGWLDENMAYLFAEYARVIFSSFGDRVKHFSTMTMPYAMCKLGYGSDKLPPKKNVTGIGEYLCMHNALKANALAYRIYNNEFRSEQGGHVGVNFQCEMTYSESSETIAVAEEAFDFSCGWQADPIFSQDGDYPEILKQRIAERSAAQGYNASRLPTFSKSWIQFIRGSADFFGLNYFTPIRVIPLPPQYILSWPNDEAFIRTQDPRWQATQNPNIKNHPNGLKDLLLTIRNKYGNPPVYIMENGAPYREDIDDYSRIDYLYWHMMAAMIAKTQDKCDVRAYTVKSLLDGFESTAGYTEKFGLFKVNFDDENRKRTPRKSALWLQRVACTRKLSPTTSKV